MLSLLFRDFACSLIDEVAGVGDMRGRERRTKPPREAFSVLTETPRDLAGRLAEVRALRELVRMKEEELEQRAQIKKKCPSGHGLHDPKIGDPLCRTETRC